MYSSSFASALGAPSWSLFGIEPLRAAFEYASMRFMDKAAHAGGDGHPVVIFPGLATDGHAIGPLKNFCADLGYVAYDWGRGFNTGPQGDVDVWLDELAAHVAQLTSRHDARISLVGWSLGGIYAREIAKKLPQRVRQVLTIGTPFAGSVEDTHAAWVYRMVNGQTADVDARMQQRLATAPPVPTTSIYSRSDGIVSWRACIQAGDAPQAESVEVEGSHCGLGWNPQVLAVVADRLRQPESQWQPYANHAKTGPAQPG